MLARFFRIGSRSVGSSFIIFSMFLYCFIIWEISFSERVRWARNRKPFGEIVSSGGLPMISLAIESRSWSPSKVRFSNRVLDLLSGIVE